jgi:hypothetical protein
MPNKYIPKDINEWHTATHWLIEFGYHKNQHHKYKALLKQKEKYLYIYKCITAISLILFIISLIWRCS